MLGHERGHPNPQIDVEAVLELLRRALRDAVPLRLRCRLLGAQLLSSGVARVGSEGGDLDSLRGGGGDDAVDVDPWKMDRIRGDGANRNYMLCLESSFKYVT